jgi:hypothetical protein
MYHLGVRNIEKHIVKISFWVIFFNSVIESFLLYFEDRYTIILMQLALNLSFFGYLYFVKFSLKFSKNFLPIVIIIAHFLVMSIWSSDPIHSYNMLLKFSIPVFFLIIGYSFSTSYLIYFFVNNIWIFLFYFSTYSLISNYFNIGYDLYRGGFIIGYNSLNGLYIPIFSIIIILFFQNQIKNRSIRVISILFSILNVLVYVAILKRTLLLILVLALIFYIFINLSPKVIIRILFLSSLSLVAFFFIFYNDFQNTLESREKYFSEEYEISAEGRVTENFHVFSIMKNDPKKLLFGTGEIFNDRKYLSFSFYERSREIHNSYARIFWNGGLFALFLFLYFYWIQGKMMLNTLAILNKKQKLYREIFWFGFVFILLRALNDLSSGITYLGFNAFCYLIIGNLFRISYILFNYRILLGREKIKLIK